MTYAISIQHLQKTYSNGFLALDDINLQVSPGEIVALLGPNGAGKTTLINAVCGIVTANAGSVEVFGHDNIKHYRTARSHIGLVPQELTTDAFETVWNTVSFSRGLFGKPASPAYIEETLKKLSLWDKKDAQIRTLSGGMKRRVMIAKALSHEPDILFLDEPSAGVDVELRKSMWAQVRQLRETGVTIILTTHYIEEAEEMADRISVINKGKLIITEEKKTLMKQLGKKELVMNLYTPLLSIPEPLSRFNLHLAQEGMHLIFTYDPAKADNDVTDLLDQLKKNAIRCKDLDTRQSSLEEIFVQLVGAS
ncbi:MAG: ABC transporter ATP-binding protein [Alphaproteobacteria bacterium]|nr:ABC transporter ATP-binding protein [Alphaproteobacteria bacterium]